MMKANLGMFDRFVRIWLGVIVAGIGIVNNSAFALLGLIPFITAAIGTCPLYSIFGIRTNKNEQLSGL